MQRRFHTHIQTHITAIMMPVHTGVIPCRCASSASVTSGFSRFTWNKPLS